MQPSSFMAYCSQFQMNLTINVGCGVKIEKTYRLFYSPQPRVSHQCGQVWSLGRGFPDVDDVMQNYSGRTSTTNLHLRQMSTKSRISLLKTRPGSRGGGYRSWGWSGQTFLFLLFPSYLINNVLQKLKYSHGFVHSLRCVRRPRSPKIFVRNIKSSTSL